MEPSTLVGLAGVGTLIERIIQLLKIRQTNDRKLFQDHVEPLFLDMTEIHEDYRKNLDEILDALRSRPDLSPQEVSTIVAGKKVYLEPIRVKVYALSTAIDSEDIRKFPEEVQDFVKSCLRYFEAGVGKALLHEWLGWCAADKQPRRRAGGGIFWLSRP